MQIKGFEISSSIVELKEENSPFFEDKDKSQISKSEIDNNNEQTEPNYCLVFGSILSNSINTFQYYILLIVMFHFAGKTKNLDLINGLGLGFSYFDFTIISPAIGLLEALSIILPREIAQKNKRAVEITIKQR